MTQTIKPNQIHIIEDSKEKALASSFENLGNRRKFVYSFKDMMWELFWFHKWRSSNKLWEQMRHRNKLFEEGVKTFHSELDYSYIIKSIRELKALVNLTLEQDQISIVQFHQNRLLSLDNKSIDEPILSLYPRIQHSNDKEHQDSLYEYEHKVSVIVNFMYLYKNSIKYFYIKYFINKKIAKPKDLFFLLKVYFKIFIVELKKYFNILAQFKNRLKNIF